jgi:hypothetical protein
VSINPAWFVIFFFPAFNTLLLPNKLKWQVKACDFPQGFWRKMIGMQHSNGKQLVIFPLGRWRKAVGIKDSKLVPKHDGA